MRAFVVYLVILLETVKLLMLSLSVSIISSNKIRKHPFHHQTHPGHKHSPILYSSWKRVGMIRHLQNRL